MFNCRTPKSPAFLTAVIFLFLARCAVAQTDSSASETNHPAIPRRPSIILIVADDLGIGDLGCYGQAQIKTPNIDRLANEGMRFTSFYGGSAIGTPSRAALLTGQDSGHGRVRGEGTVIFQPEDYTVGETLRDAGYATGAIGEWGYGGFGSTGLPSKKGFEEFFGYLSAADAQNYYPPFLFRSRKTLEKNLQLAENLDGLRNTYSDDYFNKAAINFIHVKKPQWYLHYRPFFLYLPYTIVRANNELAKTTGNGMEVPSDDPYTGQAWPKPEKNKAAMITRLDGYVGEILNSLQTNKIDNNTLVIFTSANGPHHEGGVDPNFFQSAGDLRGIKGDLYEGGIRVPFIAWWPGRIAHGISATPFALWDIPATFAQIARQPAATNTQSLSFLPTLFSQSQTGHETLYWELHEDGFKQALRSGNWKAIRNGTNGPLELYDLQKDPSEKTDVAKKNPKVVHQLEDLFKTARVDDTNWPVEPNATQPQSTKNSVPAIKGGGTLNKQ